MLKRRHVTVCTIASFFLLISTNAFLDEGQNSQKRTGFHVKQRPYAVFDHDTHNEKAAIEACHVCHHVYRNGELLESESSEDLPCSDCHHRESNDPDRSLTRAYHGLCKGCHAVKEAGPIICGE